MNASAKAQKNLHIGKITSSITSNHSQTNHGSHWWGHRVKVRNITGYKSWRDHASTIVLRAWTTPITTLLSQIMVKGSLNVDPVVVCCFLVFFFFKHSESLEMSTQKHNSFLSAWPSPLSLLGAVFPLEEGRTST